LNREARGHLPFAIAIDRDESRSDLATAESAKQRLVDTRYRDLYWSIIPLIAGFFLSVHDDEDRSILVLLEFFTDA